MDELQELLDRSFARSSEHLTSIMTPERRLSASRLRAELPCPAVLNLATVTARGEPRLSAVDGHFRNDRWYFSTAADSPKARQIQAHPAVSVSYTPKDGYGVFCHGSAVLLDGAELEDFCAHFAQVYGVPITELGEVTAYRVDPRWMVGFAMTDEEMAQIEADRAARG